MSVGQQFRHRTDLDISKHLTQTPQNWGVWKDDDFLESQKYATLQQTDEEDSILLGLWTEFPSQSTVHLRVALSNVDLEGAKKNFEAEHTGFDIEQDLEMAKQKWQSYFDALNVWGGDEREREIFATALYHTLQMPTLYSERIPINVKYSFDNVELTLSKLKTDTSFLSSASESLWWPQMCKTEVIISSTKSLKA